MSCKINEFNYKKKMLYNFFKCFGIFMILEYCKACFLSLLFVIEIGRQIVITLFNRPNLMCYFVI